MLLWTDKGSMKVHNKFVSFVNVSYHDWFMCLVAKYRYILLNFMSAQGLCTLLDEHNNVQSYWFLSSDFSKNMQQWKITIFAV